MRTKFKAWAEPYIKEHSEVSMTIEEISSFNSELYLELGSGKGKFLLDMAMNNKDKFFIGVERNVTCCGFVAKKLVENEITNAKLMFQNADLVLANLKDEVVDGLFLNFSDPWPKKRHTKRRLTANSYLDSYYRILKKGGRLIFKTDNADLFAFSVENMQESKFKVISIDDDYDGKDTFDAQTEYELSFREIGTPIHRIILEK
ncbi:MAG: tRNA (guanosine(46)-N7)-methyltransferase TrmB [Bacilli bacterium]|nr:tRNA (guanosine(46)-N7)-methyltransferase TrmB [Bacilli bacterium]